MNALNFLVDSFNLKLMAQEVPDFLTWHFLVVPKEFAAGWKNLLAFNFHFFSTKILLRTLFAPWKRKTIEKTGSGFNLNEWFTVITFNLISRIVGAIVRLCLIFWSILAEISIFVFGLLAFPLIVLLPILSLPTFFIAEKRGRWQKLVGKAQTEPLAFVGEFLKSPRGSFVFRRLGIGTEKIVEMVAQECQSGGKLLFEFSSQPTDVSDTFLQLAENWSPLNKTILSLGLKLDDVRAVLQWFDRDEEKRGKAARFWDKERLLRQPALATDWSYGYTVNLDQNATDMTQEQPFASHLVGRDKEVERIETLLCRSSQNNVLLIGQEGVGKRTVVFQLAQKILEGRVYPPLKNKRVLELNVNRVIGEGKTPIDAQNLFEDILQEAIAAGNIILVIPRIDRFLASDNERVDLSAVLGRVSASSRMQIIGITTPDLYHKYLYSNSTVGKLFEVVEIAPPGKEQATEIAENFVSQFEKGRKVLVTFQAIREAVEKSDRYITEIPFPEKALDLLDETIVAAENKGGEIVTAKEVDETLSLKTKVPVGEISKEEKDKLVNLEEIIHRRLVDQEQAVTGLANAFRRTRMDLESRKKPAGVFLFLGPTGVGKTETAKALAAAYFGSEERLVRLDMGEFQDSTANIRLLGSFEKNEPGILTKLLRDNPFCVLLLDEIEKASKEVCNLLLTAFDEGYLADNFGKKLSLKEIIIICTSNAGSEFIRSKINSGAKVEDFKTELLDYLLKESIFSPELLNRFDDVVVYKPLEFEQLKEIARLMLLGLNRKLAEKEVQLKITDQLLEEIARQGYDPVFGARPMRRLIADKIQAPLAQKLLRGEVEKGEVEITL